MTQQTLTKEDLSQFTGTEQWYRHGIARNVLYTDGAKHVAESGGAYPFQRDASRTSPRKTSGFCVTFSQRRGREIRNPPGGIVSAGVPSRQALPPLHGRRLDSRSNSTVSHEKHAKQCNTEQIVLRAKTHFTFVDEQSATLCKTVKTSDEQLQISCSTTELTRRVLVARIILLCDCGATRNRAWLDARQC